MPAALLWDPSSPGTALHTILSSVSPPHCSSSLLMSLHCYLSSPDHASGWYNNLLSSCVTHGMLHMASHHPCPGHSWGRGPVWRWVPLRQFGGL